MAYQKPIDRHEGLISAAIIAAHAHSEGKHFRQRDVLFYIELLSDWLESETLSSLSNLQSTQVARLLANLAREGFCKKSTKSGPPQFKLTRPGLIEMLARVRLEGLRASFEVFLLLYYFVANYAERLEELVKEEGQSFPYSMRLEVSVLLNSKDMLDERLNAQEKLIEKLRERVRFNETGAKEAKKLLEKNKGSKELIAAAEASHPFVLRSEKTVSELFRHSPGGVIKWELSTGRQKRVEQIWKPQLKQKEAELSILKRLED